MATTPPIPPGGIVSVPTPGGGVGAPVVVSQIVNAKWANAVTMFDRAYMLNDKAVDMLDPAPQMPLPVLDTSYVPPIKPTLPVADPNEAKAIYDDAYEQIGNLIEQGFSDFLNQNFPTGPYWNAALGWLERALTQGGTGLNVDIERALWERDRGRFLGQNEQARQEALATWANRGFDLPPGALANQLHSLDLEAGRQLAAQSRDIAIKSFEAELENARFAVQQTLELRLRSIAAAGEYIRTLILGPQTAMQLALGQVGLRTDYARTLTALYQAENAALEPRVRLAITDAQIKLEGERANLSARTQTMSDRVQAALGNAKMTADAAAASWNGIGAGASISGQDSTSG